MRLIVRGCWAATSVLALIQVAVFLIVLCWNCHDAEAFNMVMMARRGKGNLKRTLLEDDNSVPSKKGVASLNQGKGQEITGVTLPEEVSSRSSYQIAAISLVLTPSHYLTAGNSERMGVWRRRPTGLLQCRQSILGNPS